MRMDGPGHADLEQCPGCGGKSKLRPRFRCGDCHGQVLYCRDCIVKRHLENPLHRVWPLKDVGLRVQLGHLPHERCPGPEAANSGFVALHTNGIHEVAVDFCGCEGASSAGPHNVQLLRAGWFPATDERPQTCASLAVLEKFHQDTLQSKMTMYDFYGVLEKLTNNTGVKPPDRYHEWLRMCRKFRHIMMLKRAGRAAAYSTGGVFGTGPGELVLQCPACPRPGVNLPEGWEDAPPEMRFLYTLFLALDACFRLTRRLVSSELRDPDLSPGWGHLVATTPYREFLRSVTDQKEMNTCSGLAALDYANTKFSRGYSTTGVGMGVCARHEFVQPNGVGDLQKGERLPLTPNISFANMDYIFASILKHKHAGLRKLISYDIVCIWMKHLLERLKKLPANVRIEIVRTMMRFAIPKMHIHGHTLLCQLLFSLNYLIGCAETDGEGIERPWSTLGAVAASTRDMGPGSRHCVLDCQLGYWNWLKLVGIFLTLRRRMDRAKAELEEQTETFEVFSEQQRERVPAWKQAVLDYEAAYETQPDAELPSPYDFTVKGLTEAQVRLQFAEEEAAEAERGVPSIHDVSPSTFVAAGLDVENEQRRVRVHAELKKAGTIVMQTSMKRLRAKLNRSIIRFRKLQKTYMPAAFQALAKRDLPATTLAEEVPLMLPSSLTEEERARCVPGLGHIEALLRDAQCRTALVGLRCKLHVKSRLLTSKKNHVRHQGPNTRARTIVTRNEVKVRLNSEKYQCAWEALRLLYGGDERKVGWRALRRPDIRCMEDSEDLRRKERRRKAGLKRRRVRDQELRDHGLLDAEKDDDMQWEDINGEEQGEEERGPENERQVSWIWTAAGTTGSDADLDDGFDVPAALRVEWCKAFSRTRRWGEEIRLLEEEYRRVGVSFNYEADVWEARAAAIRVGVLPLAEVEGAHAYALRQADMYRDLKARGEVQWGHKRPRYLEQSSIARAAALREEERREAEAEADQWMDVEDDGGAGDAGDVAREGEDAADEEDDEFGHIESDEEFIMGGEGFDD
ncbi:hypothetical protein B0H15DRAFT_923193 [Mycena belliarum]|uniref:CxC2-like cysteine cluster KDZ transposase-associated domain-containing protein n=1 Tax=Mycena belliarum TaxID=1033014 RepID=A0AAD6XQR5_9AGAR|nr:hypothetical protein B0H15DRAFT_923193 [Mycena belliae]